jgi:hypothetical protein
MAHSKAFHKYFIFDGVGGFATDLDHRYGMRHAWDSKGESNLRSCPTENYQPFPYLTISATGHSGQDWVGQMVRRIRNGRWRLPMMCLVDAIGRGPRRFFIR